MIWDRLLCKTYDKMDISNIKKYADSTLDIYNFSRGIKR